MTMTSATIGRPLAAIAARPDGRPPRILMTTATDPSTLAACYVRGLEHTDAVIQPTILPAARSSGFFGYLRRGLQRVAPARAYPEANAHLIAEVEAFRPDVVWIFKGMDIYPRTLKSLRQRGIALINYNADHPLEYFSPGSGNANVSHAAPLFDLHITYSRRIALDLRRVFPGANVAVIPFGHDVDDQRFARIPAADEVLRACFVGNPDRHRARSVRRLAEAGVAIDVYGHGWSRLLAPVANLRIRGPVIGDEFIRTLRRYRVQLNFFRPHNIGSHNMRSFEVPASGGIMLAEDSAEHRTFFAHGRQAFFFTGPNEMVSLAQQLLAIPPHEAAAIRAAARLRSVESGYAYRDRARAALVPVVAVWNARVAGTPGGAMSNVDTIANQSAGIARQR